MKRLAIVAVMFIASAMSGLYATNSIQSVLGKLTVSRLEMQASQRRLQSRTVTNGMMICTYVQSGRSWTTTNKLFNAAGHVKPPKYSKLKLYVALSKAGKWQALKEWLQTQEVDGLNAWEAFSLAQNLSADNEMFNSWLDLAQDALKVDDKTVQYILESSEE